MYMREVDRDIIRQETPELEHTTGIECGKTPYILWKSAQWGAVLRCGAWAQTSAAQLMQDFRRDELDHQVLVKIGATLTPL
jgi:hypothetical protein